MKKMNFFTVFILIFHLFTINSVYGQKEPDGKKDNQTMMQQENMHQCMNSIAADSAKRIQMMSMMMQHMKGDSSDIMQMCRMMMGNPQMQHMMMNMMHGVEKTGSGMNPDKSDSVRNEGSRDEMHH